MWPCLCSMKLNINISNPMFVPCIYVYQHMHGIV